MTTFYNFTPSNQGPFTFRPTLDGEVYNVVVTWLLFGARYYVNIYDLSGVRIVTLPLIGSAVGVNITSITWANGLATITTVTPHGYLVGATASLTIGGVTPSGYNGLFDCFILSDTTFQFEVNYPGPVTVQGTVYYNISMTAGYFASTLVYRAANRQFEVNP